MDEKLKVNQRVEIKILKSYYVGSYSSRVEGVEHDRVILAAPIKNGRVIPLQKGQLITVSYFGKTASFSFTTAVIEFREGKVPIVIIAQPQQIVRIQRRNYLRLEACVPVVFRVVDDQEHNSRPAIYHTETVDISGGGALIRSKVRLSPEDYLEIELTIPRKGVINILGRVARVEKINGSCPIYLVGIDFLVIDETERDTIIQYVFEQQRELRRKGLL